jgi:hypothetical protein
VLITRPDHDPTTFYLHAWAEPIISSFHQKSDLRLIDLSQQSACKNSFFQCLKKDKPVCLFLNGHGTSHRVTGFNNETLISLQDGKKLKNKIIYALSCRSGLTLGPCLVDQGLKTYIGYKDDFIFIVDETKLDNPLTDEIAKLYLEPAYSVTSCLIEGKTTGEAFEESQKKFQENINFLLTTESPEDDKDLVPYLYWDMQHQVCLGDKGARI